MEGCTAKSSASPFLAPLQVSNTGAGPSAQRRDDFEGERSARAPFCGVFCAESLRLAYCAALIEVEVLRLLKLRIDDVAESGRARRAMTQGSCLELAIEVGKELSRRSVKHQAGAKKTLRLSWVIGIPVKAET